MPLFSPANVFAAGPNTVVGGPITLYVNNATGSDSNSGLSLTAPLATLSAAVAIAIRCNATGVGTYIRLAQSTGIPYDGCTYSSSGLFGNARTSNASPADIVIDGGNMANTVIGGTVTVLGFGATLNAQNVTLTPASGFALVAYQGGTIYVSGPVTFGSASASHMHADTDGFIGITSSYTIAGGAPSHWETSLRGLIWNSETAHTITLTGSPVFSTAFANIAHHGTLYCGASFVTFTGAAGATTTRFIVEHSAVIQTNNGGAAFLPGTALGREGMNGRYFPSPTPSATVAGFGTGATATVTGDDQSGIITITTGSGPAAAGTVNLTGAFLNTAGNPAFITALLQPGTAGWNARAVVQGGGTTTAPLYVLSIDNNGVAFPAGTLAIHYHIGK